MTDNASSYWAVTALVSVLAPAAAHTRAVGWQTVLASVAGVLLIFLLADLGWPDAVLMTISLLLGALGVLVLLTNGTASKLLTTQLIVILVAVAAETTPPTSPGCAYGTTPWASPWPCSAPGPRSSSPYAWRRTGPATKRNWPDRCCRLQAFSLTCVRAAAPSRYTL